MYRVLIAVVVLFGSLLVSQKAEATGYGRTGTGSHNGHVHYGHVHNGFGYPVGFNYGFGGYGLGGYGFNNFAFNNFYGNGFGGYGAGCGNTFGAGYGGFGTGYGVSSAFVYPMAVYPSFSGYGYNNNFFFGRRIVRDRFGRVFSVRGFGY